MIRFRPFVFCLAVAVTVAAALWPWLGGGYLYDQFVVGAISWRDENKAVDYQALLIVVAVFLALAWLLRKLVARLRHAGDVEAPIEHLMGLALLPLALWLGAAIVRNTAPGFPYAWAVAAATLLLFGAWLAVASQGFDRETLADLGEHVLLSLLLSFFAAAGLLLLIVHASGHALPATRAGAQNFIAAVLVLNVLVVGTLFARSRHRAGLAGALRRWLVILQYPLPLLGLVLLPAQISYRGTLEPFVWPWKLVVIVAAIALLAWVRLTRRLGRTGSDGRSLDGTLDFLPLAMIAVFLTSPHATFDLLSAPGYPTLFGDDFHMGEQILPWPQWIDFKRIPYVDFAPVHGLMPLITGALNAFFFDGTLANLNSSFSILVAISAALTIFLACRTAGVKAGLALCFILSSFDRLLFLAPALLLLAEARLLARPTLWIVAWILVTSFMLGYNAAVGLAFAGGTAPFAVWTLARAVRQGKAAQAALALLVVAAVALALLVPHLLDTVGGLLAFIAENSATNMVRHGVPFARGFMLPGNPADGVLASRVLFELLRLSWIVVGLYALLLCAADWRASRRGDSAVGTLALPLTIGLTLLLLAAWTVGRIDVEYTSRLGAVSFLAVGTLLPILYLRRGGAPPFAASMAFALIIAVFAGMVGVQERFSPVELAKRAFARVEVPPALERTAGAELGGKRLGTMFITAERRAQIASFGDALRHVLAPGQTYFDFTNRQALYYYLDRPVPALYSATYNALNERQQQRMLRQLAADPPPAVLIEPAMVADGVDASLRSLFLYRYFMRGGYRPVVFGPWIFLVNARSPAFPRDADRVREEEVLERAFAHPELQLLPAAWGRSWPALKEKARFLGDLVPASSRSPAETGCVSPSVSIGRYQLAAASDKSVPVDLLEIRMRASSSMPAMLSLRYWPLPTGHERLITMQVRGDKLIVPVVSYPSWLGSAGTPAIELCAPAGEAPAADLITGVGAWTIPDPPIAADRQVTKSP